MKNFFLIILLLISFSSCDLIDAVDGCDEPIQIELDESDSRWLIDSVQYFMKGNDTFEIKGGGYTLLDKMGTTDCQIPIQYKSSINIDQITTKNLTIYLNIYKAPNEVSIAYVFSKNTPNNLTVGVNQTMGIIDLDRNLPMPMDNSYFVYSEYLGNHTIRGREYTEVYKFTDLDRSNVPEIDVASIIVSPIGFLRIEFYDGEVWERVIVE